jgi:Bacterial regulatory proteins, lacI family
MAQSKAPSGQSNVGDSRPAPRIQDVARRAGVAIGTVSNVLNNPDLVAQRTRLKVESAIADLGFVRNSAARALRQPADHAHQTLTLDPHLIPRRSTQQGLRT